MTPTHHHRAEDRAGTDRIDAPVSSGGGWVRAAVWLPGLAVAIGAAVATAHGLYEVAAAATVPTVIAWLYPLITDGLALVAYTATARLTGSARRYAWGVVVLAAGLSGLAQASYLASADTADTNTALAADGAAVAAFEVSAALRFGIGAWPAIAAAVVAHLLYLLAESSRPAGDRPVAEASGEQRPVAAACPRATAMEDAAPVTEPLTVARDAAVVEPVGAPVLALAAGQRSAAGVHPALFNASSVHADALNTTPNERGPDPAAGVQPEVAPAGPAGPVNTPAERSPSKPLDSPVRDRAQSVARAHLARRGALPTVSELEAAAQVSRGTAATVLKALRSTPTATENPTTDRSPSENEHQNP